MLIESHPPYGHNRGVFQNFTIETAEDYLNITIVGGGNISISQYTVPKKGTLLPCSASQPSPTLSHHQNIVGPAGFWVSGGEITKATNDPAEAFPDADMIMITMPPTMLIPLAEIIYDNTDANAMIGFVPGNGGFEFVFKDFLDRGTSCSQ